MCFFVLSLVYLNYLESLPPPIYFWSPTVVALPVMDLDRSVSVESDGVSGSSGYQTGNSKPTSSSQSIKALRSVAAAGKQVAIAHRMKNADPTPGERGSPSRPWSMWEADVARTTIHNAGAAWEREMAQASDDVLVPFERTPSGSVGPTTPTATPRSVPTSPSYSPSGEYFQL